MCGIVGVFDTRGRREVSRELVSRMNESQHHRGPDEVRHCTSSPVVGLGHRRLSIIDLSTGQQPLFNEDGSVVIVYNGEIYNYQSLIPELTALGHTLSHPQRHRGHRSRVGGLGGSVRDAPARHVCVRALGPQPLDAFSRPRPSRREAAPLCAPRRRHVPVRIGAQGAACARRVATGNRSLRGGGVFRAGLRAGAAHDFQGGEEAAARAHADAAPWRPGS